MNHEDLARICEAHKASMNGKTIPVRKPKLMKVVKLPAGNEHLPAPLSLQRRVILIGFRPNGYVIIRNGGQASVFRKEYFSSVS